MGEMGGAISLATLARGEGCGHCCARGAWGKIVAARQGLCHGYNCETVTATKWELPKVETSACRSSWVLLPFLVPLLVYLFMILSELIVAKNLRAHVMRPAVTTDQMCTSVQICCSTHFI